MIEKIRLTPSKRRIWLGCIASSLLIGLGYVGVLNGHQFGWFIIILIGMGIIAPGILLLPGTWLELDDDGFTLCLWFRPDHYFWCHITDMTVWREVVSFKLNSEHRGNRRGQTVARAISGYDGSIPNMFRLDPQSLLELMIKFKQIKPTAVNAGIAPQV